MFLRELNESIFNWFDYVPKATHVDSPIDHAIETRRGVCQDFAHIMTALVRHVKIPCRYVSGYLYPRAMNPRSLLRRRDSCLGGSSAARPRLGGFRSHQ